MTKSPVALKPENESLAVYTEGVRKTPVIDWYRSPLPVQEMKALHKRSDLQGAVQTVGYLAILSTAFGWAIYAAHHAPWWVTVGAVFLYGMVASFCINAVHELGHGTVFKTKIWNQIFVHLFAFLGWINHEMFQNSHTRHHRFTLHPPDDLEVVLPTRLMIWHFFKSGFINPPSFWGAIKNTCRIARGKFQGEWESTLYPETAREVRRPAVRWARILLAGHAGIAVIAIATGHWIVAVLVSGGPFIGGGLFFLCNNTQHIGLQDNVPDFRLCCRTFTLNPFLRFLYWQMNYHTEHHMYAAVPCYHLGRLHRLIKHDLPACPDGLFAVWKEIAAIQARQDVDPGYQHRVVLPARKG